MGAISRRLIIAAPYAALLALAWLYMKTDASSVAAQVAAKNELRASKIRADSLADLADSLRHAVRKDTVVLWRVKKELDTLTVSVDRWKHDTVKVVQYVQKTDSAIRACTAVISTCQAQLLVADQRLTEQKLQTELYRKQLPSAKSKVLRTARDMLIGAGVALLVK